jgi:hypothetical protein
VITARIFLLKLAVEMTSDTNLQRLIRISRDFRFWILLFFVIRMWGITHPPISDSHHWRQVTVNMVARNFVETDANILYPRVDTTGEGTGITGMEFPLLSYLMFLLSQVFGYEHWYGRLVNLLISSVGIWYFYGIIRRFFNPKIAFYSGMILLCSVWFSYSRKAMPDTFSVSFIIAGMYYGLGYIYDRKNWQLLWFTLLVALGTLAKLPAAYLLILLAIPLFDKQVSAKTKGIFCAAGIIAMIAPFWWYFQWVPHLVEAYPSAVPVNDFMHKSIAEGFKSLLYHPNETAIKFYADALNYLGFLLFVVGLVLLALKKKRLPLIVVGLSSLFFLILMGKAGFSFWHHSYYIIPFAPVMAFVAAFAIDNIQKDWLKYTLLVAVAVEVIAARQHDFRLKDTHRLKLETIADKVSDPNDLIATNGDHNPRDIYFAHRKGWCLGQQEALNQDKLLSLKEMGCKVLLLDKTYIQNTPQLPYPIVYNDDHYIVFQLSEVKK